MKFGLMKMWVRTHLICGPQENGWDLQGHGQERSREGGCMSLS